MNVKQLKEKIQEMPDDAEVSIEFLNDLLGAHSYTLDEKDVTCFEKELIIKVAKVENRLPYHIGSLRSLI